ncbi:MAG: membrane protein insertase YidC [Candidatus Omnitrophota bacterium]
MEKRLFPAIFLTLLFFIGYNYFLSKYAPRTLPPATQITAPAAVETPTVETATEVDDNSELPQASIGKFIVTYSPRGGYIKKLSIKSYNEELPFRNIGFISQDKDKEFKSQVQDDRIVFISAQGNRKEFIFSDFLVKIKLSSPLPQRINIFSNSLSDKNLEQQFLEVFYTQNETIKKVSLKQAKNTIVSNVAFVGISAKHFCLSLLKGSYMANILPTKNTLSLELVSVPEEISLYIGPLSEKELKKLGLHSIINYGFFHGIGLILVGLLEFFFSFTKSWGISIILLSLFTYCCLFPFTMMSTKAMKKMQELQPEIEELRKKYPDNPQKVNKETLELYKKNKVNPAGSCIPMLLQFPVFIALWQVLLKFVELKGQPFLWIKDLSLPDHAFKLPFPQPVDYINILPILIVIVGIVQQKISSSSSLSSDQKNIGLVMSIVMGVVFYTFPSCLTIYWFVQNILTLSYQMRVAKTGFHVKTCKT